MRCKFDWTLIERRRAREVRSPIPLITITGGAALALLFTRAGRVPEASLRGALESLDAAARRRRRHRVGAAAADQRAFAGPCGSSDCNRSIPAPGAVGTYCTQAHPSLPSDLRDRHSSLHEIVYEYYCELSSGSPLVDQSEAELLCHLRQWAPALIRSPPGSTQ